MEVREIVTQVDEIRPAGGDRRGAEGGAPGGRAQGQERAVLESSGRTAGGDCSGKGAGAGAQSAGPATPQPPAGSRGSAQRRSMASGGRPLSLSSPGEEIFTSAARALVML